MRALVVAFAAGLSLAACDFSPSGEPPLTEIDPTIDPLDIDLAQAQDTLVLYGPVTVRPDIDDARPVGRVEVLLDDRVVAGRDGDGPISFDSRGGPDGAYRLRVRAYAPSGTGSLADRVGREEVVGETTRVALVDNAPAQAITPQLVAEDGRLTVTWDAIDRPRFEAYRVLQVNDQGQRTTRATLTAPGATRWIDSLIVGGTARYAVELAITGDSRIGPVVERDFGAAEITGAEPLARTQIQIKWTPGPFPANVDRYVLERAPRPFDPEDAFQTDETEVAALLTDSPFTDTVADPFGAVYLYRLRAVSTGAASETTSSTAQAAVDQETPFYTVHTYVESLDAFVATAEDGQGARRLVRLDGQTFEVTAELAGDPGKVIASPNGTLLLIGNDLFNNVTDVLRMVNPATFAVTQTVSRPALLGAARPSTFDGSARFTDDGRLIARYGEFYSPAFYDGLGLIVVDVPGERVLDRVDATGRRPPLFNVDYTVVSLQAASPDGRYAIVDFADRGIVLYEIGDDGALIDRGVVSNGWFPPYVFVSDTELATGDPFTPNAPLTVYSLPAFDVARTVSVRGFFEGYDRATDVVYGNAESFQGLRRLSGVDAQTGALRWSVQIARTANAARYVGGVLFGGGYVRRVEPADGVTSSAGVASGKVRRGHTTAYMPTP